MKLKLNASKISFDGTSAKIRWATGDVVFKMSNQIRDKAKQYCYVAEKTYLLGGKYPTEPGTLKNNIVSIMTSKGKFIEAKIGVSSTPENHYIGKIAHFIEYGTSRQQAHPFMRPAFNQHKSELKKQLENIKID